MFDIFRRKPPADDTTQPRRKDTGQLSPPPTAQSQPPPEIEAPTSTTAPDNRDVTGDQNARQKDVESEVPTTPVADLVARISDAVVGQIQARLGELSDSLAERIGDSIADSGDILKEALARATKEQLRTNAIAERALTELRSARAMPLPTPNTQDTRLLEALMPVLDAIEAGLESGEKQLTWLRRTHGDSGSAFSILSGWLAGQRLLRERLLALLERESVRPIVALGQQFDPYQHVAVETVYDPTRPPATVIEERRRGYELAGKHVLRFAEVVVTKNTSDY